MTAGHIALAAALVALVALAVIVGCERVRRKPDDDIKPDEWGC